MSSYKINLHEVIYSLSDALDLVGISHIHHGKRVAYMAAECGKSLGWGAERLDDLFQAGILHDAGVSNTSVHAQLTQMEWEGDQKHCDIGAAMLASSAELTKLSEIVKYHHTHWSILKDIDLPLPIKLAANCIYMVDRVDVLTTVALLKQPNILLCKDAAVRSIIERKGDWFCSELVDAFVELAYSEAFWFRLENEHVTGYTSTWISHEQYRDVKFTELLNIVKIFSKIVDAKSTYTEEHSEGVSRLARLLGEYRGLSKKKCEMIELAALLHDLGKLRVPDEVLEKPERLNPEEYATVQRHSFDTYNILKTIRGLKEVATWASQHHERADGSGYPYHLKSDQISTEARIIALADVFQALAQDRPYRGPLPPQEILAIIQEQVSEGKLDGELATIVEAHLDECYRVSLG